MHSLLLDILRETAARDSHGLLIASCNGHFGHTDTGIDKESWRISYRKGRELTGMHLTIA